VRGISLLIRLGLYRGDHLHGWIRERSRLAACETIVDLRRGPDMAESPEDPYRLVVIVADITSGAWCGEAGRRARGRSASDAERDERQAGGHGYGVVADHRPGRHEGLGQRGAGEE
jgi:hypothetical protein